MTIVSWTTERLSQDGNDLRVEWDEDSSQILTVYVDDCEVETIKLGLGTLIDKAHAAAKRYLQLVERWASDDMLERLDAAIERAQQHKLDELYAEGGDDL